MFLNQAMLLARAVDDINKFNKSAIDPMEYMNWVDQYQAQLVVLASQITWSTVVETALVNTSGKLDFGPVEDVLKIVEATLTVLADSVLQEKPPVRRIKLEHLVSDFKCCLKEN